MARSCPFGICDGSGMVVDDEHRLATPCRCRGTIVGERRARGLSNAIPRRYQGVSFDRPPITDMPAATVQVVRAYLRNLDQRLEEGRGLWLYGDVGTGKTTLAMLVSKGALEAGRSVAIYSLPRLLALLRDTYDDDAQFSLNELIDRLCAVDLLHIYDVGTEQSSAWVLEQLYTIVNTRYEDGKALVLTTNLGQEALVDQIGPRTVSRIYEICGMPLPMHGADHRVPQHMRVEGPVVDEDAIWEGAGPSRYGRPLD
jgi:DNA replication protein DnaC